MPQNPSPLRLGTRGSKLALAQATMVRALLLARGTACDIVVIKTSGDRIQDRPLADAGGKGLFVKELENALLARDIDLAVHSMKDVPVTFPGGLDIAAVLPREDVRDAFLSHVAPTLRELPRGAKIGTSSVRRRAQIARARPDLEIMLLRGNVDTRLAKLDSGQYDAILLAYAGLRRLGLAERATAVLAVADWLPALGQGAVGIEVRSEDRRVWDAVAALDDPKTRLELSCERAFQQTLDGSCRSPIAGHAAYAAGLLDFRGEVLSPDGRDCTRAQFQLSCPIDDWAAAQAHGAAAGQDIKPRAAKWLSL